MDEKPFLIACDNSGRVLTKGCAAIAQVIVARFDGTLAQTVSARDSLNGSTETSGLGTDDGRLTNRPRVAFVRLHPVYSRHKVYVIRSLPAILTGRVR